MGAPRIFTTLKVGTEVGRTQKLRDKLASVQKKLAAAAGRESLD